MTIPRTASMLVALGWLVGLVSPIAGPSAIAGRIGQTLEGVEGIEAVFIPEQYGRIGQATPDEDPHASDLWLAAREGYSFSNEAEGESVVTAGMPAGTHGFLPYHPGMRGIFTAWGEGMEPGTNLDRIANTQVAPRSQGSWNWASPRQRGNPC